jgi:hypothetical protein
MNYCCSLVEFTFADRDDYCAPDLLQNVDSMEAFDAPPGCPWRISNPRTKSATLKKDSFHQVGAGGTRAGWGVVLTVPVWWSKENIYKNFNKTSRGGYK